MAEQKEEKTNEPKVEEIKAAAEGRKCPVRKARYYITEFLAGPMCGRCLPCSLGSYEAGLRLDKIIEGSGSEADIAALRRISEEMLVGSFCKKGKDTAAFILEWMNSDVYREHIEGACPDGECAAFIEYRVMPQKCTICGLCRDACQYGAVVGEKRKPFLSGYRAFEIRQVKCVKCDACRKACPEGAIVVVGKKKRETVGV
jgi:ferredoxin